MAPVLLTAFVTPPCMCERVWSVCICMCKCLYMLVHRSIQSIPKCVCVKLVKLHFNQNCPLKMSIIAFTDDPQSNKSTTVFLCLLWFCSPCVTCICVCVYFRASGAMANASPDLDNADAQRQLNNNNRPISSGFWETECTSSKLFECSRIKALAGQRSHTD